MVDVDPDAAEVVDDLLEAVEVDGDQVVDLDARERLHRLERPGLAARLVGAVDLRLVDGLPGQWIGTRMSRGNESSEIVFAFGSARTSMIVSEREGTLLSMPFRWS